VNTCSVQPVTSGDVEPLPDPPAPLLFPEELWPLVNPIEKRLVAERFSMYSEERLRELIAQIIEDIEIYGNEIETSTAWYNKEIINDYKQRTEQDFFRAQCIANIDAFGSPDPDNPPRVKDYLVRVETTDEVPVRARPRRFTMIEQAFLEAKTNIMVRQHKLRDSHSDWSHGLVLVPYNDRIQKFLAEHGESAHVDMFKPEFENVVSTFYRLCSDMREVNKKTKLDIFPLPRLDDIMDNIPRGTDRFSTGDVMDAFFCVEVHPDDRKKFAFRTHNRHLEFEVMVQGWVNSPSHFCRIIAGAMEGLGRFNVQAYLDDVLNHASGFESHFETQQKIYDKLRENRLMFKPTKTKINFREIKFLGHILSPTGISPDPAKIEHIAKVEDPRDATGVRSFLGATLFYRRFIHKYGDIAQPLYALTKKGVNVQREWDDRIHGAAMDSLKKALTTAPVLRLFDPSRPIQIRLDACKVGRGIGAILLQQDDDGEWHPIEYWSKALSATERNYSATELECKGLHDALLHWHMYISCGQPVDVYTDHNALQYMVDKATATNNGRLLHYLMALQGYRFKLHYKKGVLNSDADWISRAWHITDFIAETRDILDTAIGPIPPTQEHPVERPWGAYQRSLKQQHRTTMRAVSFDTLSFHLPSQSSGGEEEEGHIDIQDDTHGNSQGVMCDGDDCDLDDLLQECYGVELCSAALKKLKRTFSGKRVLRNRKRAVDYNEASHDIDRPHRRDWRTAEEHQVTSTLMLAKKEGYRNLKILQSTIEEAGWGLFAATEFSERDIICSYEGAKLPLNFKEEEAVVGRDYIAMGKKPRGKTGKFDTVYIDAWELDSCYGRFINDPIDDELVNAKIVVKGNKFYVLATDKIVPGQEIFISYGESYWRARQQMLSEEKMDILEKRQSIEKKKKKFGFNPKVNIITFRQSDKVNEGVRSLGKLRELPLNPEEEKHRRALAEQHAQDLQRVEEE